jgi:hypothetical protein
MFKNRKIFNFAEIFNYAEKQYGINWNPCNDVFFGNSLEYGKHTEVYPADWSAYTSFSDVMVRPRASNYTRKEVECMTDCDKSYVILSAYFESLGVTDSVVLVDCT